MKIKVRPVRATNSRRRTPECDLLFLNPEVRNDAVHVGGGSGSPLERKAAG
jgi:hypothetical protein